MQKKTIILILSLFIIAACIRSAGLNRPLLGNFYARAIEDAMIATNYIHNGFNVLKPSVNMIVDGKPGLVLENLGLYSYLVAVSSQLLSGPIDFTGRFLSLIFSLLCGFYLFKFLLYFIDRRAAVIALFFYLFSPLSIIYGQSFQAEAMALFLLVFSLYYFILFIESKSARAFLLAFIAGASVFLVKVPWLPLILLYPWICLLICRRQGVPISKRMDAGLLIVLIITPLMTWLLYVYSMRIEPGVYISIFDEAFSGKVLLEMSYFSDPEFYYRLLGYIVELVLNPAGFILFLAGLFAVRENFLRGLLIGWLFLFGLYCLLIPKKVFMQNYYIFPLIPAMATYAGCGAALIRERIFSKNKLWLVFLGFVFILISLRYSIAPSFLTPDRFKYAVYAGREIAGNTTRDDLIIGSSRDMAYLLYYSDRLGWNFDASTMGKEAVSKIEELESLREKKASYFAVDYPTINFKNNALKHHMFRYYRPLVDNEKLILFDIRKRQKT